MLICQQLYFQEEYNDKEYQLSSDGDQISWRWWTDKTSC